MGRGALHHQFWRLTSQPRTCTRFYWGLTSGRFPSAAALTGVPSGPPSKNSLLPPPPSQPLRRLQLWIAVADSATLLSTTFHHSPSLTGWNTHSAPRCTGLFSIRGWRQGGRLFVRCPRSRSRVKHVLRPLTRGPQGQASPLRTPHGRPGVQGIFPTSGGQAPHGWPMVHHSMAIGFPIPRGCCLALSVTHRPLLQLVRDPAMTLSPLPLPVTGPLTAMVSRFQGAVVLPLPHPFPGYVHPSHPSSRVSTPPGHQQPSGAGPLDPHPCGDRVVLLARVAPIPSLLVLNTCCVLLTGPG